MNILANILKEYVVIDEAQKKKSVTKSENVRTNDKWQLRSRSENERKSDGKTLLLEKQKE